MATVAWRVCRYREPGGEFSWEEDLVVDEVPLTLHVNGIEVVTLLTLGDQPVELGVGFLRSEGFVSSREDLEGWEEGPGTLRVRVSRDIEAVRRLLEKRTVTTGCGKGTTFYHALDALRCRPVASSVTFHPGDLLLRMRELQARSELYRLTGGTHNASLVIGAETRLFRTDIGRHNAVDMIGGRAFLDGLDLTGAALLTTGRVSSEILVKVAKMGVPVLVSRSAPTALALRLAVEQGVTVVGYVRSGKFNVYTHAGRVEGAQSEETGAGYGSG